jgi:hypothetical protein
MTYYEKLKKNTCLFCGAPVIINEKCNYCGCHYLEKKEFKELLSDYIEIDAVSLDYTDRANRLSLEFDIECDYKYFDMLYCWFNLVCKNIGIINKRDYAKKLLINYKDYKILCENTFIKSITKQEKTKDKIGLLKIDVCFDMYYLEVVNG